jgi:hypothetical protein
VNLFIPELVEGKQSRKSVEIPIDLLAQSNDFLLENKLNQSTDG